jgi:hypothetical protein
MAFLLQIVERSVVRYIVQRSASEEIQRCATGPQVEFCSGLELSNMWMIDNFLDFTQFCLILRQK